MILIGLSGAAHSGKDTVADMLVKDYGFTKMAFADSLKEMIQQHYGFKTEELWTDYKTEEVRRILQGTGELIKNLEGDSFWIHRLQDKMMYKSMISGWIPRIVISDVRFENEKNFIEGCSVGITIGIDRPDNEPVEYNPKHVSERGLRDFDYVVINRGGITELGENIDEIMRNEDISQLPR